jgi:hypothetical protein
MGRYVKRVSVAFLLITAAGLALSAQGLAARGDSIKGKGSLNDGLSFKINARSAADTPIPPSGTFTSTDPSGTKTTESVSCLNVVDASHAYVGAPVSSNVTAVFSSRLTVRTPSPCTKRPRLIARPRARCRRRLQPSA